MKPVITPFFDERTNTASYVMAEPDGPCCAVVDSVLDFDYKSGRTYTESADRMIAHIEGNALQLEWILETHAHADHLSAAPYIKAQIGGKTGIGEHIASVQTLFAKMFNLEPEFACDGSQFDKLFCEGEEFSVGELKVSTIVTPGHTPACVTYIAGDTAFVGDTLFMPDYGTARTDFPGGNARTLYRSIQRILSLPDNTRLFLCHDYKSSTRSEYRWETTVAEQKSNNVQLANGITEDDFVTLRESRDKTLKAPKLLFPSIQVNIRAGNLPPAEDNGVSYIKVPLNQLK